MTSALYRIGGPAAIASATPASAGPSVITTTPLDPLASYETNQLAEVVAERLSALPGNEMHDVFYRHGFHLLRKHFYLPIPDDTDNLENYWGRPSQLAGIDTNDHVALNLMNDILPPYLSEFRERFPINGPVDPPGFYLINGGYMAVDAHVYYGLIRHFKPRRIIEVGNGNSTLLAIAACAKNKDEGAETHLISIDPYPWCSFSQPGSGLNEMIVKPIQDVPLSEFEKLEAGDIFFIDSSHVIRSGNDVHYEYLEILPRLKPGVLVHIHDISLPKPYPKVYYDNHLYWNEQYLLQAFLAFNSAYEVVWPGNYMMETYPERMLERFPEIKIMRASYPSSEPTAFWMRVKIK